MREGDSADCVELVVAVVSERVAVREDALVCTDYIPEDLAVFVPKTGNKQVKNQSNRKPKTLNHITCPAS